MTWSSWISASACQGASVSSMRNEADDISDIPTAIPVGTTKSIQWNGALVSCPRFLSFAALLGVITDPPLVVDDRNLRRVLPFLPCSSGSPNDRMSDSYFALHRALLSSLTATRKDQGNNFPNSLIPFLVLQPIVNNQNQGKNTFRVLSTLATVLSALCVFPHLIRTLQVDESPP